MPCLLSQRPCLNWRTEHPPLLPCLPSQGLHQKRLLGWHLLLTFKFPSSSIPYSDFPWWRCDSHRITASELPSPGAVLGNSLDQNFLKVRWCSWAIHKAQIQWQLAAMILTLSLVTKPIWNEQNPVLLPESVRWDVERNTLPASRISQLLFCIVGWWEAPIIFHFYSIGV